MTRPVLETEDEPRGNAIVVRVLDEIAACEQFAVERTQREKAAHETLDVSHGHRFGRRGDWQKQRGGDYCNEDVLDGHLDDMCKFRSRTPPRSRTIDQLPAGDGDSSAPIRRTTASIR